MTEDATIEIEIAIDTGSTPLADKGNINGNINDNEITTATATLSTASMGTNNDIEKGTTETEKDDDDDKKAEKTVEVDESSSSLSEVSRRPPYLDFLGTKTDEWGRIVCTVAIAAYSLAAFVLDFRRARLLFVVEVLVVGLVLLRYATDRFFEEQTTRAKHRVIDWILEDLEESKIAGGVLLLVTVVIVGVTTKDHPQNLVSALGMVVFVGLSWLTSYKPGKVRWRPVVSGIVLQFLLGFLVLRVAPIARAFAWLGEIVTVFLSYTNAGAMFVFGYLADPSLGNTPLVTADGGETTLYAPFYFTVLSVIFFVSSVVSVLNYLGVIRILVQSVGVTLAMLMGTSGPETFNCVANIFLSMTESPLLIRPLLSGVTESELHAIMTAGFASVAGSVLAAYISFGASPSDLLAATIMSAPAALGISKLVYPETTVRKDRESLFALEMAKSTDPNIVAAASSGASLAVDMVLQIGANLIAFIALVAMLDGFLKGIGSLIDVTLSFNIICSYLFYPVAWLMGVPTVDCLQVASLIGTKIVVNEFAAYAHLGEMIRGGTLSARSVTIATYALCGFSNLGSIGITVAVLSSLTEERVKPKITKLVTSAMIAGNTACFMTACVAGLLYTDSIV